MRTPALILALTAVALMSIPTDASAQKKERQARPAPARQIACTRAGCITVPPGCRSEIEYDWDQLPTGFNIIVCPRYR